MPRPLPPPDQPDEFTDHGIMQSRVASGLAGKPIRIEPHAFVYDAHFHIFKEIEQQKDDLKALDGEVRGAIQAAIAEVVLRRKLAELTGREVSGLAAWEFYAECKAHIEEHWDFFEQRLDSHVLQVLTHGRSPAGSESH